MPGVPELRQQISRLIERVYGVQVCADSEVTITSGATEALFVAIQALVRTGDEVIVFDPAYDSYQPAVELAGGKTVHIQLCAPDYRVDWAAVERRISDRTRLIIVNSPHNPTGMVFTDLDWQALADLVQRHGLFCISDEVYEHMVFDDRKPQSARQYPALAERSFIVSSFGKTFHVTGWKLGYCTAPKLLSAEFRKIHQYVTFSSFTPAQYAIAELLDTAPQLVTGLAAFYQQKRDLFQQLLSGSALRLLPCQGTYFQLVDFSAVSTLDDVRFCDWLTTEVGVAAIPLSVFSRQEQDSRIIRFCLAKQQHTLEQAAARLRALPPIAA
jgi:methionine aminotransferase